MSRALPTSSIDTKIDPPSDPNTSKWRKLLSCSISSIDSSTYAKASEARYKAQPLTYDGKRQTRHGHAQRWLMKRRVKLNPYRLFFSTMLPAYMVLVLRCACYHHKNWTLSMCTTGNRPNSDLCRNPLDFFLFYPAPPRNNLLSANNSNWIIQRRNYPSNIKSFELRCLISTTW